MSDYTIGVVGNPNCGKTTLFNALTGAKQRVGNWPGVTVERKTGQCGFDGMCLQIVDLPGTYSLDVIEREVALDERIARDYVHDGGADLIVNIVDASNLERNLYLTSQLVEMKVPLVVALNMMDVAEQRGLIVDAQALAERLGCPVVPIVATEGKGIQELKRAILKAAKARPRATAQIRYDEALERAVGELVPRLTGAVQAHGPSPRWLAVRLLEGDDLAQKAASQVLGENKDEVLQPLRESLEEDIDILIADARYGFANRLTRETVQKAGEVSRNSTDRIDRVVLNRTLGIPIFLGVMYLMFMFTINIGSAFIDFFDRFTGTIVVDGFAEALSGLGSPDWLTVLLANGIGGGIQVVATFIPVIGFLYLFLSVLEDSGYMARAAFVMDRFMRWVGLPGKSFVPMLVGFGCNVPAIMATRTLERQRDRFLTILMNPFMSCGARLPVYALFAAAFFPVGGQNLVFGLYLLGILAAIMTGLIMKHTVVRGDTAPFVMELPSYHLPTVKGVLLRTWDRLKTFIFRAGKLLVPAVLVINVLNAIGTDGSFGHEDTDQSVLSAVGRTITPVFAPMGLDEENWPAAVGVFTGLLAKEAIVGTLDAMYTALAEEDAGTAQDAIEKEAGFDFWGGIGDAFATVPANLANALDTWTDPLGVGIGDVSSIETAAGEQEVTTGTFGAMVARFDGKIGAFAYLLFVLLYFPCVAATAAVYRETNLGWTMFVGAWTTGLAYIVATTFYQAATFARHPGSSLAWITGMLSIFLVTVLALRWWGRREAGMRALTPERV